MSNLKEHVGELVVIRCWCGIQLAIPSSLREIQLKARDEGRSHSVYCPLGHTFIPSGESRTCNLKRRLAAERARHDQTRADRDHKQNQLRGERGAKTRLSKKLARVKKGVCPCCNRTFVNLQRHMAGQHPEFTAESTDAK